LLALIIMSWSLDYHSLVLILKGGLSIMIKVNNISKKFGEKTVLHDINLTIGHKEIVAIVGPSGSGKSTLLRCINFLEEPTTGHIVIDGKEITHKNATEKRQKMGMVFQHFNLFNGKTLLENIIYGPMTLRHKTREQAENKAYELLERVGLDDKAHTLPRDLSGGQKQRGAIARALAMEPDIMLFDEATSALDPETVKEVLDVIRDLAHSGMTIVIVTHEMSFARELSHRVVFMDHGRILEETPTRAFFEKPQAARAQEFLSKVL
jgi:ABC-type polar amino acid transport system ATPase subunit